jgi:hypothetical protein
MPALPRRTAVIARAGNASPVLGESFLFAAALAVVVVLAVVVAAFVVLTAIAEAAALVVVVARVVTAVAAGAVVVVVSAAAVVVSGIAVVVTASAVVVVSAIASVVVVSATATTAGTVVVSVVTASSALALRITPLPRIIAADIAAALTLHIIFFIIITSKNRVLYQNFNVFIIYIRMNFSESDTNSKNFFEIQKKYSCGPYSAGVFIIVGE